MHPLALLASDNQAGIAENLHMVRHGWLSDIDFLVEAACAFLAVLKQLNNLYAVFITKSFEHLGCFFLAQFHYTHHIEKCLYIYYINIYQLIKTKFLPEQRKTAKQDIIMLGGVFPVIGSEQICFESYSHSLNSF